MHLVILIYAIIITIAPLCINAIDGDGLTGICQMTASNHLFLLNLVPKIICVLVTLALAVLIAMKLMKFMGKSTEKSTENIEKLRKSGMKIGWCLVVFFGCGIGSIAMEFRVSSNIDYWDDSLYEFLICNARQSTQTYKCNELLEKPDKVYRIVMEFCTCLPSILAFFLLFDPIKELKSTWKEGLFRILGLIVENGEFSIN